MMRRPMLLPEQVVPFLQHNDPIVREHVRRYFQDTHDFGPLTADHYWALIDRLGESENTIGFAADLKHVPQTDGSLRRVVRALATKNPPRKPQIKGIGIGRIVTRAMLDILRFV